MKGKIVATVILVYVIPFVLLICFLGETSQGDVPKQPENPTEATQGALESTDITVSVLNDGQVMEMSLEKYVLCVTLAEMPADFELEALKVQSVVARTYTYKKMEDPKHEYGAVCTDSACCQAYISPEEYLKAGGTQENLDKVSQAVSATARQVVTYQGAYIEATYFSCSGGRTEDAQAVWGNDVPYLQSVESSGEEQAVHYTDTVTFLRADFLQKLGLSDQTVLVDGISYTEGGGVATVCVCGKEFTGTKIREKLNLRSTAFVITAVGDKVTVTTKGFGHRVGLSQYGAEAMAVQGKTYEEILLHYYVGTELTSLLG